jgi:hypothetical protein
LILDFRFRANVRRDTEGAIVSQGGKGEIKRQKSKIEGQKRRAPLQARGSSHQCCFLPFDF